MNTLKLLFVKFWKHACLIKPEAFTLLNFIFWRWQISAKYLQFISSLPRKPCIYIYQYSPLQLCLRLSLGYVIKGLLLHWHSKRHSPYPRATWQCSRSCFLSFLYLKSSLWEGSWERCEARVYFPVVLQKICNLALLEGSLLTCLFSNYMIRLKTVAWY